MARADRHKKKKSAFWKGYLVYLGVIAIALIALFFYVRSTMVEYERNSSDNYSLWLVEDASQGSELGEYLAKYNFADDRYSSGSAREDAFYSKLENSELTVAASSLGHGSSNPAYDVLADGKPFVTISLIENGSTTKLGIMTLSNWEIEYAIVRDANSEGISLADDKTLNYQLIVPEGFTLQIDGAAADITADSEVTLADFEYIEAYVDVPKGLVYNVSGVYYEPTFSVVNNGGEELSFESNADGTYSVDVAFVASPEAKELCESVCDPLEIGQIWSKFMTDDVGGSYHGLYTVREKCMLLSGTNLYDRATKWASNVDITFVSGHTLDNFSNASVTNYVQYNENLFSVDVYFEKNMTLSRGLGPRTDVFSNRMFFGNVDGNGWRLLDMLSLEY